MEIKKCTLEDVPQLALFNKQFSRYMRFEK